jgi:hypothetical protein
MNLSYMVITFAGETSSYVELLSNCITKPGPRYTPILHPEFHPNCLSTLEAAKIFLSQPRLDPRFSAEEVVIRIKGPTARKNDLPT